MDFVTHLPRTSRKHDVIWVIMDRLTKSALFFFRANDLHTGGILQVVYTGDSMVAWSSSLHSIGSGSSVYGSVLEEFLEGHGDTAFNEYRFSSLDGWSIRGDY